MKTLISNPALLLLALVGVAAAELPKKPPITKYSGLWTNSPFTSKPPEPDREDPPNPLDDYALIGVSSLGSKNYRVTLINKKKPDEPRIYVESGSESKGFKIVKVDRKQGDPTGTVVHMESGTMRGTVSYDEKLLTIATAAPKAAPPQPGGAPPVPVPVPQPPGQGGPQRQPRPRVVPPPAAGGQLQGQVQPGQPNQGGQQFRGNTQGGPQGRGNNQRPSRRGN